MDVLKNEHCDYPDELEAAIALVERRINERLPQASGDRTDALAAIGLIKFWSTPLSSANKGWVIPIESDHFQ